MDIGLPDISGTEVTRQIRAFSDKNKATIPIVALTGHVGEEKRQECLESGLDEILYKPAQLTTLKEVLQHFFFSKRKETDKKEALA